MSKLHPAADPRLNVSISHTLRARARKKADSEGKSMSQIITALLRGYVAEKKVA